MNAVSPEFDAMETEMLELVDAVLAEDATDAQLARLDAIVAESAAGRQAYLQCIEDTARLRSWSAAAKAIPASPFAEAKPAEPRVADAVVAPAGQPAQPGVLGRWMPRLGHPLLWVDLGVGVLFVGYVTFITWNMLGKHRSHGVDANRASVASIVDATSAEWSAPAYNSAISNQQSAISNQNSEISSHKSEIASGEPLEIVSGLVELKLKQGTTLTVQGPAQWSIDGDNRATLLAGKVHAVVPPQAVGFLLKTPAAQIVDLGTEFTAEANSPSETTLQVIRGEVRIDDANRASASAGRHVRAGQACRIELATGGQSHIEAIPFDAATFAIPQIADTPIERWQKASRKLLADPSLVAYYDFEDHAHPSLPDDAPSRQSRLINAKADRLHGQVFSPTRDSSWTTGRWREKRALALAPNFAYAEVPDDPALQLKDQGTIALWFRPDAKHWRKHMLMVAKGSLPQCSYSLWLGPDRRVRFLAVGTKGEVCKCDSQSRMTLNRWHLAVVTIASGEVRLYIDGVLSRARQFDVEFVANQDPLQLGRPAESQGWPVFVGVVDELALFNRVQSAEEIAAMYEAGRPD